VAQASCLGLLQSQTLLLACAIGLVVLSGPLAAEESDDQRRLEAIAFSGATDTTSAGALHQLVHQYWLPVNRSFPDINRRLADELQRYREAEAPPLALTYLEIDLGMSYKMLNQPSESIKHLYAALALVHDLERPDLRALIHQEIGLNYYLQRRWQQAMEFFQQADTFFLATGQMDRHATQMYLIGLSASNSGDVQRALSLLQPLYHQWLAKDDARRALETGSGYADALRRVKDLDSAERLYRFLTLYAEQHALHNTVIMCRLQAGLSQVLLEQGRTVEAHEAASVAMDYVKKYEYFFPQLEALEVLHRSSSAMGRWEDAYRYLELLTQTRDSLQSEETNVQLGVARAVFDHEQQAAQIRSDESRKRQVMTVGLILSALLITVVGFFYRSLSRQKARSESLLANILPKETIGELKRTGEVIPRVHLGVSIMFCDVRDFTRIAESLSPHELVSMLDTYIRAFDEIIQRHGLEKIKTIGDAYMVAGGLHGEADRAAMDTIHAAVEILRAVEDLRGPSLERYGFAFDYRIGIHTGNVIAGMVGRDKYAYDIWGDAVNVASRMEQHSEVGRVNISGDTNALVASTIPTEYRGQITVKNKGDVDMYFVTLGS